MRGTKNSQENAKRRRKSKTRRQSMTVTGNGCPKASDEKQEKENVEVEDVDENEKSPKYKIKKQATGGPQTSVYTTLMANNRALAAALEDAQLELRSVYQENVQLKKQIHESHHKLVEKSNELEKQLRSLEQLSGNHVPKEAQAVFHDVYDLLNQTTAQFLQGSKFLSDAVHLVSSALTPANESLAFQSGKTHLSSPHLTFNDVSPYVDPVVDAACTTPPPDEPSAMEITASQSIIIEVNDTLMKPLDKEQEDISGDTPTMDIGPSQGTGRRAKRKSSVGVSYAEPNLNSKLRRGDRFTDTTLFGEESLTNNRKKKKSLTQSKRSTSLPDMRSAKKRAPLTNLTNIIKEEC